MLQGLSVIAMVCLHLFSKNYVGLYEPVLFIGNTPVCFCFSQLSDFCVFGFAFCSGYGHMKLFGQNNYFKKRLKSLGILLINFWLILFASTIVSIISGLVEFLPGSVSEYLGTMFLFDMHYNGAWWYLWAYILLVLISPLVLKAVNKLPPVLILSISFLIYCAAFYVRFYLSTENYFLVRFGPFGMTFFEYIFGAVMAKILFFTNIRKLRIKIPFIVRCIFSCLLILGLFFARTFIIPNVFFAPLSGFIIITMFALWKKPKWVENTFMFLGKHSTNIWLTHMFFVSSLWIYFAKYPLAIFLLLVSITIAISFVASCAMKGVTTVLNKVIK